jgi:hypothetical protein
VSWSCPNAASKFLGSLRRPRERSASSRASSEGAAVDEVVRDTGARDAAGCEDSGRRDVEREDGREWVGVGMWPLPKP